MFTPTKNPNSRVVTIFRSKTFLERAQGSDIGDYFSEAKMSIGSYWEKNQLKVPSGLSFKEQDLLLPHLINMESDERGFRQKVEDFYHEMDTKVPHNTGVKLEIGLEESNDSPVSKTNMPINVSDYVRYRVIMNHPEVAHSKEEAEGNSLKKYYIFDPEAVQKEKNKIEKEQDSALQAYLAVKSEPLKVDMMLLLLGVDPRSLDKDPGAHSERLKKLALEKPNDFVTIKNLKNFEVRYMIEMMVKTGVLKKIGTKYQDVETKAFVGHDLEETIAFFIDPNHDQELIAYKARLQEASKRPYDPGKKMTELK